MLYPLNFLQKSPLHDTLGQVNLDAQFDRFELPKGQLEGSCKYSSFSFSFNFSYSSNSFYFTYINSSNSYYALFLNCHVLVFKPYVVSNDMFARAFDKLLKELDIFD